MDYNTLIQNIINDKLYTTQPLKRIILCFDDKNRLFQIITNTDNHGYFYIVNDKGELIQN